MNEVIDRLEQGARQRRHVLRMLTATVLLTTALLGMVVWQSYAARVDLIDSQRAGCERSKLDRVANAEGWTAHRKYISRVTRAASVKEDVKQAARTAVRTYAWVSSDLAERSRIDCTEAFPDASLLP